jgi:hypothetical protein
MSSVPGESWFLAFCVEIYMTVKGISGQDAWNYLYRPGASGYIIDCRDALHTAGPSYIVESIDEYILNYIISGRFFPLKVVYTRYLRSGSLTRQSASFLYDLCPT